MLWLALHFPNLPLEVFSASNTDSEQALVVLENNRVYQRNMAAQARGIELGTTLATAHSIYPQLQHTARKPSAEIRRLNALADALYRFSSYISIQAPDCVLLEVGGSLKLFGCHQKLTDETLVLLEQLGHRAVGRIAPTPWAAIALARTQAPQLADVPLHSAGLTLAGIPENVIERFANMGIYTLGPLLNLPNKAVGRRFGKALLQYIAQLTGTTSDPRSAKHPAEAFEQTLHLLKPISDKTDLHEPGLSPMHKLATELQHWLVGRQMGCEALQWAFSSHHGNKICIPIRFAKGKQSAADLLRISILKLEQAELPAEVLSVSLSSQRLHPWIGNSQNLFGLSVAQADSADTSNAEMSELIDELNARLGQHTCRTIHVRNQHTPESAWLYTSAYQTRRNADTGYIQQMSKRPLWLFDPPRRIARDELKLLQGPERIQSQWWQTPSTCRDYYIAQHQHGPECWAFIDETTQWYLHGYFG